MDLIIRALVEAGYFRARISSLSHFDKVIGGMAWAMQVFSQEIDINIFYADTLDLGQKIALTERLVMVLLVVNCPHKIEPHQIVGLDHANLLPVIKWLIRRSSEIRREHEAFNRLLALRHYHRVTNTLTCRGDWCRVLTIRHLKSLKTRTATTSALGDVNKADDNFIRRLERDFKDNQLISFVDSQPAFMSKPDEAQTNRDDNGQNIEDESSDENQSEPETSPIKAEEGEIEPESRANESRANDQLAASSGTAKIHEELDTELLATNQKILTQLKKLDSMPSELEIIQYQRRYIELHQELISKNKDLKKIYALFNSLDSVKHYLDKEINLLDSIMVNLELTNNNPGNRFEFLRQFQEIILKIQAVRAEVDGRSEAMQKRRDSLNEQYFSLRKQYEGTS